MKRKCRQYDVNNFLTGFPELAERNIEVWIDTDNADDILAFILAKKKDGGYKYKKKLQRILYLVFSNTYAKDLYTKENISDNTKDVTAMKFKGKSADNTRIYCKEIYRNGKKVVMVVKYDKDEFDKKTKNIIEKIGGYEYEF